MPVRKRTEKKDAPTTARLPLVKRGLLIDKPAPRLVTRVFHRTPVALFEGRVRILDIEGWVENERIAVLVRKFEHQFSRRPTSKELYSLLIENDREFKIKELARSIFWNGVRVPIIVDSDGKLLDGNRRYFACLHLLKTDTDNRDNYETVNALVLPPDVDESIKRKVIIEMNFVEDPKLDWSPYVKARLVHKEYEMQRAPDRKELADRFGWTTTKVLEAIETISIVDQFIHFHSERSTPDEDEVLRRLGDEMEAEIKAAENYTLFWEARNKYGKQLEDDIDFKEWFFDMMAFSPFKSIAEVRMLWEAWQDPQARGELTKRTPQGVERAILFRKAAKAGVEVVDIDSVDAVVRQEKYEKRLLHFADFLMRMPAGVLGALSPECRQKLSDALEYILDLRKVAEDRAAKSGS